MDYVDPVNKLLNYGSCETIKEWPDYLTIGLAHEHIPELIQLAQDLGIESLELEDLIVVD